MAKEKTTITKPTSQLDLEARLADDYQNPSAIGAVMVNPSQLGEGAYVGTDPIYQNYANDTEKPLKAESGVNKKVEDAFREAAKPREGRELVDDSGLGGKAERVNLPQQQLSVDARGEEAKAQADAEAKADADSSTDEDGNKKDDEGKDGQTPTPPAPPAPPAN